MSPTDAAAIDQWVLKADVHPNDREAAEAAISISNGDVIGHLESATTLADLSDDGKAWLKQVIDRQRPYREHRQREIVQIQADTEWNMRTALAAYDTAGRKDARWDALAREAIQTFVTPGKGGTPETAALLARTVAAGCDDPFILYLDAESGQLSKTMDAATQEQIFRQAVDGFETSDYPADRKLFAVVRYMLLVKNGDNSSTGTKVVRPPLMPEAVETLGRLGEEAQKKLWPQVTAEPGLPEYFLVDLANLLMEAIVSDDPDRKVAFDAVFPGLQAALPDSPTPLVFEGTFYINYAWDARGYGYADTVTADGAAKMKERLDLASDALVKAWNMAPDRPEAATQMITVELGQGKGRDVMEMWFARAMSANPNNKAACEAKLYYLLPKWYGSADDAIQFGHECLAGRNWGADLPFILVEAQEDLSRYPDATKRLNYLHSTAVWADIKSVYQPITLARPDEPVLASRYAYYACIAKQWKLAAKLFDRLGDKVVAQQFGGAAALERYRQQVQDHSTTEPPTGN
jgi:hypothetical protein